MKKQNILIVEDNLIIALDLQERLMSRGYHIPAIASNGLQAVANASDFKPDLIMMDVGLKGEMNGIEAAQKIRETYEVPIIYVTGNCEILHQHRISDPCIGKPYDDRELEEKIDSLLSSKVF